MDSQDSGNDERPGLLQRALRVWRKARAFRPLSFFLMFAVLAVVLLGSQVVYIREDPWRYALFLSLNFAFFLVVIFLAVVDCMEIVRNHFREREKVFRDTLGKEEFVEEMRERLERDREDQ